MTCPSSLSIESLSKIEIASLIDYSIVGITSIVPINSFASSCEIESLKAIKSGLSFSFF